MRFLLDSNVLILLLKGDEAAIRLLVTLAGLSSEPFAVSCVARMEVWEGLYAAPDRRAAEQHAQEFFDELTLLPFDSAVAKRCARLRHDLKQRGTRTRARALDLQIAATALHHGLELVTYNQQDYADIPGLALYQD